MSKGKDSMTRLRWAHIKVMPSCTKRFICMGRQTLNAGRNKAKREARAA